MSNHPNKIIKLGRKSISDKQVYTLPLLKPDPFSRLFRINNKSRL
jgi:hypothetical protein